MFEDSVILRLRRAYSKDEAFAFMDAELKKTRFELGECKSHIAELEDTIKELKRHPKVTKPEWSPDERLTVHQLNELKTKGWIQEILKDEAMKELENQMKCLKERTEKVSKYRNKCHEYAGEIFMLKEKLKKYEKENLSET